MTLKERAYKGLGRAVSHGKWLIVTVIVGAVMSLVSLTAAIAGIVVAGLPWYLEFRRGLGVFVGVLLALIGAGLLYLRPNLQTQPLASCSVYPVPFFQVGATPPLTYGAAPAATTGDRQPWIAAARTRTDAQLRILEGAQDRIYQARAGAIEHARDTGNALVSLDALLTETEMRLVEQAMMTPEQQTYVRAAIAATADRLARSTSTEAAFNAAWQADEQVSRVARSALALTNLDNEIAALFSGIQQPAYALDAFVRGRDLFFRESLSIRLVGGRFVRIDPSALADAARQRGIREPRVLWSTSSGQPLRTVPGGAFTIDGGSPSVTLAVEWTLKDAVVDTCQRLSVLAFQAVNIPVPPSYRGTMRGSVVPASKNEAVPVAVTFDGNNTLRSVSVPAYSLFIPSAPVQQSEAVGANGGEQVLTLATPVTAESLSVTPLWFELLPPLFRSATVQGWKERLFPANAAVTFLIVGLTMVVSALALPEPSRK